MLERFASKYAVRRMLAANGLPTVPGSRGIVTDLSDALDQAAEAGYPVLLKPSAGGGGRGMRLVRSPREMETSLPLARSEAQAAFGDDSVYFEKWIEESRHVEVQVLVDRHGNGVHLGERDCSVQRRHQKIIEEGPSPAMDDAARERLRDLAIRSVIAAGYESAGTLEFLLDADGNFYFIEINCRIQVEHPVTEMVTGLDLIAEQIRIAAGEPLSLRQEQVAFRGHAIEFRINAEDPSDNFSPQTGEIETARPARWPRRPGRHPPLRRLRGAAVLRQPAGQAHRMGRNARDRAGAFAARARRDRDRWDQDQHAVPPWDHRQRRLPRGARQHEPARPGRPGGLRRQLKRSEPEEPMTTEPPHTAPTLPLEAADIMRILPHRYPFLLVDRVVELEPGKRAVGIKAVTANEPQFTGHFPGRPIMPGVLMVEALAQTAGIAVLTLDEYRGKLGLFAGIDDCRFKRMVVPGDTLRLKVEVEKLRGMFGRVRAWRASTGRSPWRRRLRSSSRATRRSAGDSPMRDGERRVVVTGMGALTPVGNDVPAFWDGLVNGRSGITRITSFDPVKTASQGRRRDQGLRRGRR